MSMKALLIVSAVAGMGDYKVEMPSMAECLEARVSIMEQMKDANVTKSDAQRVSICVPAIAETDKMEKFFGIFMSIVEQMKELENGSRGIDTPYYECSDCKG